MWRARPSTATPRHGTYVTAVAKACSEPRRRNQGRALSTLPLALPSRSLARSLALSSHHTTSVISMPCGSVGLLRRRSVCAIPERIPHTPHILPPGTLAHTRHLGRVIHPSQQIAHGVHHNRKLMAHLAVGRAQRPHKPQELHSQLPHSQLPHRPQSVHRSRPTRRTRATKKSSTAWWEACDWERGATGQCLAEGAASADGKRAASADGKRSFRCLLSTVAGKPSQLSRRAQLVLFMSPICCWRLRPPTWLGGGSSSFA